jgi:hypothetical protein
VTAWRRVGKLKMQWKSWTNNQVCQCVSLKTRAKVRELWDQAEIKRFIIFQV